MGIKLSVDTNNNFENYTNKSLNQNYKSTSSPTSISRSNSANVVTPEELNLYSSPMPQSISSNIVTSVSVENIDELYNAIYNNMSGEKKESADQINDSITTLNILKKETEKNIEELEKELEQTKDKNTKQELKDKITEMRATVASIEGMVQEYKYAIIILSDEYQNFTNGAYTEQKMKYGDYKKFSEEHPNAYISDPETDGIDAELYDYIYKYNDEVTCRIPVEVDINSIPSNINNNSSTYITPYAQKDIDAFASVVNSANEKIKKVDKEYMSIDQRNFYLFTLYYAGPDAAYKYYESIRNNLLAKQGKELAEKRIASLDINDKEQVEASIKNFILVAGTGETDGLANFFDGINNTLFSDGVISAEDYEKLYFLQYLEEHSKYYDEIYSVSSSIGNMVPSMTASTIVTLLGGPELAVPLASSLMGTSAGGNAKELALQKGADQLTAILYGAVIGFSEGYLGEKIGNIPGISDSVKLSLAGIFKEGVEECTQEYIEGFSQALLLGESIDLSNMNKDARKAFMLGCATSFILNTGKASLDIMFNGKKYNMNVLKLLEYLHENDVINMEELTVNNSIAKVVKLDAAMQSEIDSIIENAEENGRYSLFMNDGVMAKLYGPDRVKLFATIKKIDSNFNLPLEFGRFLEDVSNDPDYVIGVHRANYIYDGDNSNQLMSVMSEGLLNQKIGNEQARPSNTFTLFDSNSIGGLLAFADGYKENNTTVVAAFPSYAVDEELNIKDEIFIDDIYDMSGDTPRIKPEHIVCAIKKESNGLDSVILRSEFLPSIISDKINTNVAQAKAEGRYSIFMFDWVLEDLNNSPKPDLRYYYYEEYDKYCNIPIECGEVLNEYFNDPNYELGIHRATYHYVNGESSELTSIMTTGVKNEGHNNAPGGAHLDKVPEPYTTFTGLPTDSLSGIINLSFSYSGSNTTIIVAFPSDAVSFKAEGMDVSLNFVDENSPDKVYYYPNGGTYETGGTPYVKPEYIVGAIIKNADGTNTFVTREDYLNGNY